VSTGKVTADLFESIDDTRPSREAMAEGAVLLRGFARPCEAELLPALREIVKQAPFRHLITPGGHRMSVAMTNCGNVGWVSDETGYRYDPVDPQSNQPWPGMPPVLRKLAADAALDAGFDGFAPEACLINRYVPGAKLSLHQDKGRTGFCCADRVGVAGAACGVSVRWHEARG
jgi:DNA oxidative demethylase